MRNFYILCVVVATFVYSTRAESNNKEADKIDASSVRGREKRGFDRFDNGFSNFMSKRGLDLLDSYNSFGSAGFGKRGFDRLDGYGNSFGSAAFGKRGFDRFDSFNMGSSLGKRGFDRFDASGPMGFAGLTKRRFDSFDNSNFNNGFRRKRTLDKLDGMGAFSSGF